MSSPAIGRAILMMGPTGAGKSALVAELAERLPIEIISVDSAQVYRGMDIGTAKPDAETRRRTAHHLLDIRDPTMGYSAGEFVVDAATAMHEIWRRGRQPVFVGGTMLYFHALTAGIADLPEGNRELRAQIDAEAAASSWGDMHRRLAAVDPEAAANIHRNDAQRIQRALEVFRLCGTPISILQRVRTSVLHDIDVVEVAVAPADRFALHRRIERRFRGMLAAGLVDEVRRLRGSWPLTEAHAAMRAVGYRQLWRHVVGDRPFDVAVEEAIAATRQLAKRQFTWLKARSGTTWLDSEQPSAISELQRVLSRGGITGWI